MAGGATVPGRSVISKITAILLALADEGGCALTEIAVRSGLPLSTVHRLVTELACWQVLVRGEDGRYRTGPPWRRSRHRGGRRR